MTAVKKEQVRSPTLKRGASGKWVTEKTGSEPRTPGTITATVRETPLSVHKLWHLLDVRRGKTGVDMVERVRKGFSFKVVRLLSDELEMSATQFAHTYLGMSPSTTSRRRKSGQLNEDESDKALRFARLIASATELHEGDEEAARRWLETPLPIFGEETPLEYAKSEAGCREVHELITRLEYGMFS